MRYEWTLYTKGYIKGSGTIGMFTKGHIKKLGKCLSFFVWLEEGQNGPRPTITYPTTVKERYSFETWLISLPSYVVSGFLNEYRRYESLRRLLALSPTVTIDGPRNPPLHQLARLADRYDRYCSLEERDRRVRERTRGTRSLDTCSSVV